MIYKILSVIPLRLSIRLLDWSVIVTYYVTLFFQYKNAFYIEGFHFTLSPKDKSPDNGSNFLTFHESILNHCF